MSLFFFSKVRAFLSGSLGGILRVFSCFVCWVFRSIIF